MKTRQEQARSQLLDVFTRSQLETIYEGDRPWLASIAELKAAIMANWPADEIEMRLETLQRTAR